jgi:hypothetical protein
VSSKLQRSVISLTCLPLFLLLVRVVVLSHHLLWFMVRCWLFIVHRSSFIVHRSLFIVHRSSFIVHRSSFIVHRSSFIVHRSSFIVHRSSFNVQRSTFNVQRSTFNVRQPTTPSTKNLPFFRACFRPLLHVHYVHPLTDEHSTLSTTASLSI